MQKLKGFKAKEEEGDEKKTKPPKKIRIEKPYPYRLF